MEKLITELLKEKFDGVSEALLKRLAKKITARGGLMVQSHRYHLHLQRKRDADDKQAR